MNRLITPLSGQYLHKTPEKEVNQQTAFKGGFFMGEMYVRITWC